MSDQQRAGREPMQYMGPGLLQLQALPPLSLYVHLPWCLKKCPYCDFNSHEISQVSQVSGSGLSADLEKQYTSALIADLESALPLIWGRSVQSIFFGGGTPSLFSAAGMDRLLGDIRARVRLAGDCEISLEANPGTFEKNRFRDFRKAGINRLSVGVQSFNDQHLKAIGRVHDSAQALAAVEEVANTFENFNLDIMYALPGQMLDDVRSDVQTALSFAPSHISIYQLSIEPNTVFAKYPPQIPEEDTAYAMLDSITELTEAAGLNRYEVSAYARPGRQCVHNLNYWQFGDYLGIGAGAHSKLSFAHRIVRQVRLREPLSYMRGAMQAQAISQDEDVARSELPFEFMLNALRLKDGFALADFCERTALPLSSIESGLREAEKKCLIERDAVRVKPTERGFDFLSDLQALFLSNPV